MQVEIGRITKLDDGYVLGMHGKLHVARDAKELGRLVTKFAGRRVKEPTTAQSPFQEENPPANVTPIRPPELSVEEQRRLDDRNLSRLISARLNNQISEEDLMRGAEAVVKTYTMEEVARIAFMAEEQYFNAKSAVAEHGLGPKCTCPECPQNVSYPNERGQCVGCYQGEHLHPGGQHGSNYTGHPEAVHDGHDLDAEGDGDGSGSTEAAIDLDDDGNGWPPGDNAGNGDVRLPGNGGRDATPVPVFEPLPADDDPDAYGRPEDHEEPRTEQTR